MVNQDKIENERLKTQIRLLKSQLVIENNQGKMLQDVREQLEASENARKRLQENLIEMANEMEIKSKKADETLAESNRHNQLLIQAQAE